MGEDDPTPRLHRPRVQSSEDRDLARRARTNPFGIPVQANRPVRDADDLTSPFDLLEREANDEVRAVVEKAPRNAGDPATYEDVVKLAVALSRERTGNRQREREAEEVLREPTRAARSSRRNLVVAVIAAAISLASAIERRLDHTPAAASVETAPGPQIDEIRSQFQRQFDQRAEQLRAQFQHDIDRLDAELRAIREVLGRRSEIQPLVSAGATPALTVTTQGMHP